MITYRLADSLPQEILLKLQEELAGKSRGSAQSDEAPTDRWLCLKDCQSAWPIETQQEKRKLVEKYLDQGLGSCLLQNPACAKIIADNWQHFNGEGYDLIAFVVMPNHCHLLIKTYDGWPLGALVKTWKSFTTKEIRKYWQNKDRLSHGEEGLDASLHADYQSALPGF